MSPQERIRSFWMLRIAAVTYPVFAFIIFVTGRSAVLAAACLLIALVSEIVAQMQQTKIRNEIWETGR